MSAERQHPTVADVDRVRVEGASYVGERERTEFLSIKVMKNQDILMSFAFRKFKRSIMPICTFHTGGPQTLWPLTPTNEAVVMCLVWSRHRGAEDIIYISKKQFIPYFAQSKKRNLLPLSCLYVKHEAVISSRLS